MTRTTTRRRRRRRSTTRRRWPSRRSRRGPRRPRPLELGLGCRFLFEPFGPQVGAHLSSAMVAALSTPQGRESKLEVFCRRPLAYMTGGTAGVWGVIARSFLGRLHSVGPEFVEGRHCWRRCIPWVWECVFLLCGLLLLPLFLLREHCFLSCVCMSPTVCVPEISASCVCGDEPVAPRRSSPRLLLIRGRGPDRPMYIAFCPPCSRRWGVF